MGPNQVGPRRVGPRRVEPRRVGGPKISRFFFPPPATIFILLPLSWGPCVEFWWCLKRRGPEMCTFGVLGLSCEAPAARSGGAAGVSHDSPRAQTCTFQDTCASKHHQNSTRRPPERHRNSETVAGKGKKKREILGGPAEGGPVEGGSGGRWSREVQTSDNHDNHNHNNAKPRTSGAPPAPPSKV